MKFSLVKCWFISTPVYDINAIDKQKPDIQLVKKSILKNAYRAFCIDQRELIEESAWYRDFLQGNKVLFYIEGSGVYKLANIDLIENEFYFERNNLPAGYRPWIFFSWQSDYNPSRSHIKDALEEVVYDVNNNRKPRAKIELVESTRSEDGVKDIAEAIRRNLDQCLIAVFDITNVADVVPKEGSLSTKSYPNANVIFEFSYTLQKKREDQIILIRQEREGVASLEVPFDFRQHRHIKYKKPANLKDQLTRTVIQTLERIDWIF